MAHTYAVAIVNQQVPACLYIQQACRRYLDMLKPEVQTAGAEIDQFYFSAEHAIEACAFIETLHHIKGEKAGENLILEPWQIWMVCAIYGFRWQNDGLRVVNVIYAEIPRKHGKSLLLAAIGWYETTVNAGIGDDLYIIAPKFDQGLKVLEPMQKMAIHNKALTQCFDIKSTKKTSLVRKTDSGIIVLASVGEKQDGHDPKVVIADEFHAVPADIYKVMKSAQRARKEALFAQIGSAGRFTFGVGWDERCEAVDVLAGKIKRPNLFAAIYTVDPEDVANWFTESAIRKANPGIEVSVGLRKTMQEAEEARSSPVKKVEFLRTALNLWGYSEATLFPAERYARCYVPDLKIEQMAGLRGWIGLDLASRDDMVAMVVLFERRIGTVSNVEGNLVPDVDLFAFAWHWVPEKGPWTEDDDLTGPYTSWHEQHHLTFTRGSRHRYGEVDRKIRELCRDFDIQNIVIDDQQANELYNSLQDAKMPVVAYRKSAPNHSDPTKDLMARINNEERSFYHDGNPVLAWNMQNVIGGPDTSDRILGKKVSPHSNQKIDGFDALVQANASRLQMLMPEIVGKNPMLERGMRKL